MEQCLGCPSRFPREVPNVGREQHQCPYQHDVNNDDEFTCNCCERCTQECGEDI